MNINYILGAAHFFCAKDENILEQYSNLSELNFIHTGIIFQRNIKNKNVNSFENINKNYLSILRCSKSGFDINVIYVNTNR